MLFYFIFRLHQVLTWPYFILSPQQLKHFLQHFFIIEMLFYSFDLLVFFMALPGNKHDVIALRHVYSGFNRLLPVGYGNIFSACCATQLSFHIQQYLAWIFTTRVVAGKYYFIAMLAGHGSHYRSFGFIPVATTAYHGDHLLVSLF